MANDDLYEARLQNKTPSKEYIQFLYRNVLPAGVSIIAVTVLFMVTTRVIVIIVARRTNTAALIEKLI